MVDLSIKIGNLSFKNPVMVASGTFGYGVEFKDIINLNQLGAVITKTITLEPRDGNPPPRIAETTAGMLNSIGLANVGVEAFIREKMPFLTSLDTRIIVNVAGKTAEEFPEIIQRLENVSGIDAYEVNYSCPNVKQGGLAFSSDPVVAEQVTTMVRRITKRPIIAKLTPNVTSIQEIGLAVQNGGADAISAINTLVGMGIDIRSRKPLLSTITGGLSGPAIKPVAIAKVYQLFRTVNIPTIGIGGIMNADDAIEFMLAGATAIQFGTVNFIDPGVLTTAAEKMAEYCKKSETTAITELIGAMKPYS